MLETYGVVKGVTAAAAMALRALLCAASAAGVLADYPSCITGTSASGAVLGSQSCQIGTGALAQASRVAPCLGRGSGGMRRHVCLTRARPQEHAAVIAGGVPRAAIMGSHLQAGRRRLRTAATATVASLSSVGAERVAASATAGRARRQASRRNAQ